jgi:hypothetical protein
MHSTTTIAIVVVVAVIVIGITAWFAFRKRRSEQLRQRFGPEYDRLVHEQKDPRRAETLLEKREKRVERLRIVALPEATRAHYAERWAAVQHRFVDDPRGAVTEADHLLTEVMNARGYPMGDFEQRASDISVHYSRVVQNYRIAHDISLRHNRGEASTEDLRKAMVHCRSLFEELLESSKPQRKEVA